MNATFEPSCSGFGVSHSTDEMFWYHRDTFDGSAANAATRSTGALIVRSDTTSTRTPTSWRTTTAPHRRRPGRVVARIVGYRWVHAAAVSLRGALRGRVSPSAWPRTP